MLRELATYLQRERERERERREGDEGERKGGSCGEED